jgi:hypothetical protein
MASLWRSHRAKHYLTAFFYGITASLEHLQQLFEERIRGHG